MAELRGAIRCIRSHPSDPVTPFRPQRLSKVRCWSGSRRRIPGSRRPKATEDGGCRCPPLARKALTRHRALQAAERLAGGEAWRANDLIVASELGQPLPWRVLRTELRRIGLPTVRRTIYAIVPLLCCFRRGYRPRWCR